MAGANRTLRGRPSQSSPARKKPAKAVRSVAGKALAGKALAGKALAGKALAGKALAGKALAKKVAPKKPSKPAKPVPKAKPVKAKPAPKPAKAPAKTASIKPAASKSKAPPPKAAAAKAAKAPPASKAPPPKAPASKAPAAKVPAAKVPAAKAPAAKVPAPKVAPPPKAQPKAAAPVAKAPAPVAALAAKPAAPGKKLGSSAILPPAGPKPAQPLSVPAPAAAPTFKPLKSKTISGKAPIEPRPDKFVSPAKLPRVSRPPEPKARPLPMKKREGPPTLPPQTARPRPRTLEDRLQSLRELQAKATAGQRAELEYRLELSWIHHDSAIEGTVYEPSELIATLDRVKELKQQQAAAAALLPPPPPPPPPPSVPPAPSTVPPPAGIGSNPPPPTFPSTLPAPPPLVMPSVLPPPPLPPVSIAPSSALVWTPVQEEIRQHKAAIDLVRELATHKKEPITLDTIRALYATLAPDDDDPKGPIKYRKDMPLHRVYFHEISTPDKIPGLMRQLMQWLDSEETRRTMHPTRIASRAHYKLLRAFPFTKHSGKVARLLMNLLLLREGYPPVILHATDRQRYYDAIKVSSDATAKVVNDALENGVESELRYWHRLFGIEESP
jgi:Fic family protein